MNRFVRSTLIMPLACSYSLEQTVHTSIQMFRDTCLQLTVVPITMPVQYGVDCSVNLSFTNVEAHRPFVIMNINTLIIIF